MALDAPLTFTAVQAVVPMVGDTAAIKMHSPCMDLDTGNVARHLCSDRSAMSALTTSTTTFGFRSVSGQVLKSNLVGQVEFTVYNEIKRCKETVVIPDVVYVPDAKMDLLSTNQLEDQGLYCDFTTLSLRSYDSDGNVSFITKMAIKPSGMKCLASHI